MVQARRHSVWRNRYDIMVDGRIVATWDPATWRSGGSFTLEGRSYQLRSNAWGSRYTLLDAAGAPVASADRVGRKRWTVESDGRRYDFQRASIWGTEHELVVDGRRVGSVRRTSSWRGDLAADLPGMPLPLQIFVLGILIITWNEVSVAATAAAASA